MIIDCHTHWGDCFQARDGHDPARWLAVFDRYGVRHAVVLPFAGLLHAGKIGLDNDDVAAVCANSSGRMIPFCTVNSWFPGDATAEFERCLTMGFRGIKFHPWLQGQPVNSRGMDLVCELAAAHGVPVLFHDGTPPYSLPSQIALLARRHPKTRLVLGHCGLLEHWREAIAALNAADNLWGCLCGPHAAGLREIVRRCDTARLVWGSDAGFNFYDAIGYRLQILDVLGLSDDVRRAILEENPMRLLNVKDVTPA
jgi:predicted TIM-barrel fold metal-dependent hydrolase